MRTGLRRLLAPPVFSGDAERTDAAVLVHYGILFAFVINLITLPALVLAGDPAGRILLTEGTIFAALALHAFALRRGHVRGTAIAFLVLAWAALAAANATAGGVQAPGYAIHILLVLCAGFLFGGPTVFLTAGASMLLGLAFLLLERRGALPAAGVANTPLRHWAIVSASLAAAAAVTALMVRRLRGALAEARDEVRVRRRAEADLARHQAVLEEQVRIRTADLAAANEELHRGIAQRRRLEEDLLRCQKLDSVGVLAGGIAHDFNNLLTVVLGNAELARLLPPEETRAALGEIERAGFQARELTQQLLTFSRGGAPVKRPTDLRAVLEGAVQLALSGSAVLPRWSVAGELRAVDGDPGQLGQVFRNLALNAVQAMPRGGVIRIEAGNEDVGSAELPLRPGPYVRVAITDEGPGIPPELRGRVFDPYFTTRPGGSGLGLAVAHSIVRNHGGHIGLASTVGAGATFTVHLPAASGWVEPVPAEVAPATGGGRVLVMDDDPSVRRVAALLLKAAGYEVETASEGAEAVAACRRALASARPFGAVVLDLTVPGGMGGREAVRRILEIDPGVGTVASSGYSNDPVMASPREHGFARVVAKPWRAAELARAVAEAMRRP